MVQLVTEAGTGLLVGDTAMYPHISLEEDDRALQRDVTAACCSDGCTMQSTTETSELSRKRGGGA
jgi:hypothetical protein